MELYIILILAIFGINVAYSFSIYQPHPPPSQIIAVSFFFYLFVIFLFSVDLSLVQNV